MLVLAHVLSVCAAFVVIVIADKEAFAWFRGRKPMLSHPRMHLIHTWMWSALSLIIVTGIFLLYPTRVYLLAEPAFQIKMLFVLILAVNALLIDRLMMLTFTRTYASLTLDEKMPLFVSGAVSLMAWLGALGIALVLFAR